MTTSKRIAPADEAPAPVERGDCFRQACPARAILAHVSGRWGSLVIAALHDGGTLRFSQLRSRIEGISEKMLAQTLRDLERDGLLSRASYPVVPPRVEYALTSLGQGVANHVAALVDWIEGHVQNVTRSHAEHDGARSEMPTPESRPRAAG